MAEEYKQPSFEESEKERADKDEVNRRRMDKIRLDTYNWMKEDKAVQEYLQQFSAYSQDGFMRHYAFCKSLFTEYGDNSNAIKEQRDEGNIYEAQQRLMDIQRKKLFDVMLQWDANLLKPEGIVCSWDFYVWEKDLSQCPFITPISQEEFDLFMRYALSSDFNYNEDIHFIDLNDVDENGQSDLPEWFLFENLYTGNDKYLLLPHTRTEKEEYYRGLGFDERNNELEKKYEKGELQRPVKDERPMAPYYYYNGIEDFVKRFENKEALNKFHNYYARNTEHLIREDEEEQEHGYLNERVQDIVMYLKDIKEKIPVSAQSDWRLAVIEAWDNYNKKQIQTDLQYAYSDYCNRLANGVAYLKDEKETMHMAELAENVKNQILRGRELNGEPRNFDF